MYFSFHRLSYKVDIFYQANFRSILTKQMLLIRNRAIAWSVRRTRDLFKNNTEEPQKQQTSNPASTNKETQHVDSRIQPQIDEANLKFPYKFKGVTKKYPSFPLPPLLFPTEAQMINLYIDLLRAIEKKDEKKLSTLVEPSLVKPLMLQNFKAKFVQSNNSSRVEINSMDHGFGVKENRSDTSKIVSVDTDDMPPLNNFGLAQKAKMYMSENFNFEEHMHQGIPILFSLETTIISKNRLVISSDDSNDIEQSHYLTFENEKSFNMLHAMKMTKQMNFMKNISSPNDISDKSKRQIRNIVEQMLNSNAKKWRIGNIDHYLKSRWPS